MKQHRPHRRTWGWTHWALCALILAAWGLRLPPALVNRLHADEALYGYWGLLIGRGQDVWLTTVPVYKPPVMPYLTALTQICFGAHELAVRWVGLSAGLLLVPLVAALARGMYRDRWSAIGAGAIVALSPFVILFSATAFTDPPMVALGVAACVAAIRRRAGWAGLWLGLSCATKQTGVVWAPLVMLLLWSRKEQFGATIGALSVVGACVAGWDFLRVQAGAESFWQTGVTGYGGLRLIWPHELWDRGRAWQRWARYFYAAPALNIGTMLALPMLVGLARWKRDVLGSWYDLTVAFFCVVYWLFHWLVAFPVWDRYLLPLLPVVAVATSRWLSILVAALRVAILRRLPSWVCPLLLMLALIGPAWNGAHSRYPVGGDHWAYDGIDRVADFLSHLPTGSVVYQHWLGWHYSYYLFDAPVYIAYWPTPSWLAHDVQTFGAVGERYITFPSWESSARVAQALRTVGYRLSPVQIAYRRDGSPSFVVYRIRAL